jgi:uncharacterized protein YbaR (Trm112 family)
MPIKKELLDILCCPVTKEPLEMLAADKLAHVNDLIAEGKIKTVDGKPVETKIVEALITTDGKTIYRIDDDIPVMLVDMGIPTDQIADW